MVLYGLLLVTMQAKSGVLQHLGKLLNIHFLPAPSAEFGTSPLVPMGRCGLRKMGRSGVSQQTDKLLNYLRLRFLDFLISLLALMALYGLQIATASSGLHLKASIGSMFYRIMSLGFTSKAALIVR
jgi:hypothetical protein